MPADTTTDHFLGRLSAPLRDEVSLASDNLLRDPAGTLGAARASFAGSVGGDRLTHRLWLSMVISGVAVGSLSAAGHCPAHPLLDDLPVSRDGANNRKTEGFNISPEALAGVAQAMKRTTSETTTRHWPCPNCGGKGPKLAQAELWGGKSIPYARLHFDFDALIAPYTEQHPLSREQWSLVGGRLEQRLGLATDVCQCENCGLAYMDWPYDPARVADFYASAIGAETVVDGVSMAGRAHLLPFVFTKVAFPLFVEETVGSLSGRTVFDLGCAEGIMAAAFQALDAVVAGADPDAAKVAYGQKILGLDRLETTATALDHLPDNSVDLLVCYHTLEHLPSVDTTLDKMVRAIAPGGHLAVAVPNAMPLANGQMLEMGGDHLIGFNRRSLGDFFNRHGLTVIEARVDDGSLPADQLDPVFGLPVWAGRKWDLSMIGRKSA